MKDKNTSSVYQNYCMKGLDTASMNQPILQILSKQMIERGNNTMGTSIFYSPIDPLPGHCVKLPETRYVQNDNQTVWLFR